MIADIAIFVIVCSIGLLVARFMLAPTNHSGVDESNSEEPDANRKA